MSLSLWMNKLGRPRSAYGVLVGVEEYGDSPDDAFSLAIDGTASTLRFSVQQSDFTYDPVTLTSATAIVNGVWRHVAVVFQPGVRMAIYLDGQLDAEMTDGVPYDVNTLTDAFLTIGNLDAGGGIDTYCFNGLLDQVRFYSGLLTEAEIAALAAEVYLVPGDANGDGLVDDADAAILAAHWQAAESARATRAISTATAPSTPPTPRSSPPTGAMARAKRQACPSRATSPCSWR